MRNADSRDSTEKYLAYNPDLSFVAEMERSVVGCVMSGHNGRRGYLQHLVVLLSFQRKGIANELVEQCLAKLQALGILKTHINVFKTNKLAQSYWSSRIGPAKAGR